MGNVCWEVAASCHLAEVVDIRHRFSIKRCLCPVVVIAHAVCVINACHIAYCIYTPLNARSTILICIGHRRRSDACVTDTAP